ncbi:MAG: ATP-binding domain-containing protein, partial [Deltaproteobacteria bacterium]|nr:ATP-binding domain-containing protein [Deltaproteobacteria bacterium]
DREAAGVGMQDYVIELRRSYRFHPGGGISRVSAAVNSGDEAGASELLREGGFDDIKWMGLPTPRRLSEVLAPYVVEGFGRYLETDDPAEAIRHFNEFRILCAVREGPYGVTHINSLAENILRDNGTVSPGRVWYHGRPVMITRNDCSLHLFNGDVGLAMSDPDSGGDIRVFFPGADGAARKFHPMRLPEHETVFATTVHKSQGSEFTKILLILPDRPSPVLTRELIYTGITRAREKVTVCTPEAVFRIAVERRIKRTSGLRDALWGVGTPFTLNRP